MTAERTDKNRRASKTPAIAVDIVLAFVTTLLMMRTQLPAMLHQVAGIAFGMLAGVHMWQHRAWLSALLHGKLHGRQLISAVGMAVILVCAAALIVSGLMMSTWATDLGIATGTGGARRLHLPLSHTLTPPSATTIANDLVAHPCQGPSSGMGISPWNFTGGGDSARGL